MTIANPPADGDDKWCILIRNFIILIIMGLLLSSCAKESSFDVSMRLGKEALKSGNYEEAIKQFDSALIDKPTNKDAMILYDRAVNSKSNQDKVLAKEKLDLDKIEKMKPYRESRLKVIIGVNLLIPKIEDKTTFTVKEQREVMDDIDGLRSQLKSINDFERETSEGGLLRIIDRITLDAKIENAITNIETSYKRKITYPDSKYNNEGLKTAKGIILEWEKEVDKYK